MMKKTTLFLAFLCICGVASAQEKWVDLFNGKNLKGWSVMGGSAPFTVEKGAIVGTANRGGGDTYLATAKPYGDFVLELEVWMPEGANSGIQFRSQSKKEGRNQSVYGYQYELDGEKSGGVYDELRRGWLYNLNYNPKAKGLLKTNEWNKIRMEAVGVNIRTYLNGTACANLVDEMTPAGFIALQIRGGKDASLPAQQVKFRNIRILTDDVRACCTPAADVDAPQVSFLDNKLTEREESDGWRLLFDGKTTNGWRGAKTATFPTEGWSVKDGVLVIAKTDGRESANAGDIVTEQQYSEFELEADFFLTEGANSGIKYYVDCSLNKGDGSAIGCEYQLLDDLRHPDAKLGVKGNRTLGSLYDLITAEPNKPFYGIGTWNRARIVSKGNKVEHWLNGVCIVSYERNNQMWRALVAYSKYRDWPAFGEMEFGNILLQDHGDEAHFKNIKIKNLRTK